jgi:hypothetical protein
MRPAGAVSVTGGKPALERPADADADAAASLVKVLRFMNVLIAELITLMKILR